jgi:23S rRNA (uracil1939-C5)-methyltransferase
MLLETSEIRKWRQGDRVEVTIDNLSDSGDGVGRVNDLVIFIPDTVPGDRVLAKMAVVKTNYATAQLLDVLQASDDRVRPSCIVADKCGGCQWQHVSYRQQLESKREQVVQALFRIGGFDEHLQVDEVLSVGEAYHYRNKATYPLSIAERNQPEAKLRDPMRSIVHGQVIAGYYQKGTHSIVNLNQCPIQDTHLNPLLAEIKKDIGKAKWPIYDEKTHQGNVRHLSLRVGRRTGEILLTIVAKDRKLNDLWKQCSEWMQRFGLVGVCLNINTEKGNVILGPETFCIVGQGYLTERFGGLKFQIRPETFFQVYTEQAEAMLYEIEQELNLTGKETIVDAYCGIGTLSLPLSKQVKRVIGIEIMASSIEQAKINAEQNGIEFHTGRVETLLAGLLGMTDESNEGMIQPDVVVLDPPRKGCDRRVLDTLLQVKANRIVYMSCNPATLARDLKILCADNVYKLTRVQPGDFFPQTTHVEAVAFLEL